MADFHTRRWRTARAIHHCQECGRTITPRERYAQHAGRRWGESWPAFGEFACCAHCEILRSMSVYLTNAEDWSFGYMDQQELLNPDFARKDDPLYPTWLRLVVGFRSRWRHRDGALWRVAKLPAEVPDISG
jgi:hypothetical protein